MLKFFRIFFSFKSAGIGFSSIVTFGFVLIFLLQQAMNWARLERADLFPIFSWISKLEQIDWDWQLRTRGFKEPAGNVAVISIGEKSIQKLGRFPFSRKIYADLLRKLREAQVKVVAFDMVFAEEERLQWNESLKKKIIERFGSNSLANLETDYQRFSPDKDLGGEVLQNKPKVILGFVYENISSNQTVNSSESPSGSFNDLDFRNYLSNGFFGVNAVLPIESLRNKSFGLGHFNTQLDNDGVIRRVPLFLKSDHDMSKLLSLRAVEAYLEHDAVFDAVKKQISIGENHRFSVGNSGEIFLQFYGNGEEFKFYELSDILDDVIDSNELKNKILFVGATAWGLNDIRNFPLNPSAPGVLVHATLVSNILQNDFINIGVYYVLAGLLSLLAGGALIIWYTTRFNSLLSLSLLVGQCLLQYSLAKYEFRNFQWVPLVVPLLGFVGTYATILIFKFIQTERERNFIKNAFSSYVSSGVVSEILKAPEKLGLSGRKDELTVLFADLKGFTAISENMDAADVANMLNDYFTCMTEVVLKSNGTVDKFMGDALMCFWGAPIKFSTHAQDACNAALVMQKKLIEKNLEWEQKRGVKLGVRIGINTGWMSVGNMGSEKIFSYTVVGDQVNLAARLESANNDYGTQIIVGKNVAVKLKEKFLFRRLENRKLRGREKSEDIFELRSVFPVSKSEVDFVSCYERALAEWENKQFKSALENIEMALRIDPKDAASLRLREMISHAMEAKEWPNQKIS